MKACLLALVIGANTLVPQSAWGQASLLAEAPIPQSFGINVHFTDENLPDQVAYLKQAGFGWLRTDMNWHVVEQQKGIYDFSRYDRMVDAMEGAGIRILYVLAYDSPHYDKDTSPISAEAREAYASFAAAAAQHYRGRTVAWEIYNEPNIGFWRPEPNVGQYVALADEATAAIRRSDPGAVVVGPALAGPMLDPNLEPGAEDFLGEVLKSDAAHQWSAITVHPYRGAAATPESAAPQLEKIRAMMRGSGLDPAKVPLVAAEWGYSTWLRGVSEERQAAYAVREFLWATVEHMPFTVWYDWQDDGPNALDKEHRFGLLRRGSVKDDREEDLLKPAFAAVRRAGELLHGFRFQALVQDDDVVVASYANGDEIAYAAWSKDGKRRPAQLTLPRGDWMAIPVGTGIGAQISVGGALPLDEMPTIVRKKAVAK